MFKSTIYNFIFILILSSCANIQAPSGGPKDISPPIIIETFPINKTVNYKHNFVSLKFNKYMNKGKVVEDVSISPELKLSFSWSGKELEIEFEEELEENTTYSLVLGTEYTDYLGNKPAEAYSLVFSSGSKLDSGRIDGKLFDEKPADKFIFAYKLDSINADTLNIFHTSPDYKVQCGSSGKFTFNALKSGNYRLIAIDDKMKNNVLDEKLDKFGAALRDVFVNEKITPFIPIKIGKPIDLTGPQIINVVSKQNRNLEITFDEAIDLNSIDKTLLLITDSLGNKSMVIEDLYYPNSTDSNKVDIFLGERLDTNFVWKLDISQLKILDTLGNEYHDSLSKEFFFSHKDRRLKKGNLITKFPKDSSDNYQIKNFILEFDQFINIDIPDSTFILRTDSMATVIKFKIINPKMIELLLKDELKYEQWHTLELDFNNINSYNDMLFIDSIVKISFKTISEPVYNKISGSFADSLNSCINYNLEFFSKKNRHILNLKNKSNWAIDKIIKGSYTYFLYCDLNKNNIYDHGFPFPYKTSEPFSILEPEKIEVKERWDVEDIIIKY